MSGNRSPLLYRLTLVALAGFAFAAIWLSTPWGVGTSPDSITYLREAGRLADGGNFLDWSRHWPPLYALSLAAFSAITGEPILAARLLQALLFAANTLLVAFVVAQAAGRRAYAGILAATCFVLHLDAYLIHFMAWSEALFIFFLLLLMGLLNRQLARDRWSNLVALAVVTGLAILTRYAGLAFLAAVALILLFAPGQGLMARTQRCVTFVLLALSLPLIWFIASKTVNPGEETRTLAFHLIDWARIRTMGQVMLGWFHLQPLGWPLALVLAAGSVVAVLWAGQRSSGRIRMLTITAITLAVFYMGFLFVSISLFDYYTPLDQRILLPAFVLSLIAIASALSSIVVSHRMAGRVVMLLVTFFVLVGLPQYSRQLSAHTQQGVGYFSRAVRQMPILAYVGQSHFPLVYSNAPELVTLYFGGTARMLPSYWDISANRPRPEFDSEMRQMMRALKQKGGALVYFQAFAWRSYLPSREDIEKISELSNRYSKADGTVFVAPPGKDTE